MTMNDPEVVKVWATLHQIAKCENMPNCPNHGIDCPTCGAPKGYECVGPYVHQAREDLLRGKK